MPVFDIILKAALDGKPCEILIEKVMAGNLERAMQYAIAKHGESNLEVREERRVA